MIILIHRKPFKDMHVYISEVIKGEINEKYGKRE